MPNRSPPISSGEATDYHISVTEMVASVLTKGDLRPGTPGALRAQEGTWAHQKLQKNRSGDYRKEVTVSISVPFKESTTSNRLIIQGRIDGVLQEENETVLEEIKTTTEKLDTIDPDEEGVHLGQLKIYGYIYALQNDLRDRQEKIRLDLVYFHWHSQETRRLVRRYTFAQLHAFFEKVVGRYKEFLRRIREWQSMRNHSIENLSFPFSYRAGQKRFCESVSSAIQDSTALFAQAPTGVGKTLAVLYPSIKALASGLCSRIFYLTARTTARINAERALEQMRTKGLRLKSVTLTAKQKICFLQENISHGGGSKCTARECSFAKGYYDRLPEAMDAIFAEDSYTRPLIEESSKKFRLCPFEFSLDLSLYADCIIGDYNYLFDPRVSLKRYFGTDEAYRRTGETYRRKREISYIFLIDEAHNLPERVRQMYSADLDKSEILAVRRLSSHFPQLKKRLTSLNRSFLDLGKTLAEMGRLSFAQQEAPEALYEPLWAAREAMEEVLRTEPFEHLPEQFLEVLYRIRAFLAIHELFDNTYVTVIHKRRSNVKVKLLCLDPSGPIRRAIDRGRTAVFFSATLSPFEYFQRMLGGQEQDSVLQLSSSFAKENLLVCLDDQISTRLRHRDSSYRRIGLHVSKLIMPRRGNYLVYFPSYAYLERVYEEFIELSPHTEVLKQEPGMNEQQREEFLRLFKENPTKTLVGFAVIGGIFGEGIDLVGERLTGVVVVGVGLPQISFERDLLKHYFEQVEDEQTFANTQALEERGAGRGFHFAYTFPGFNRIHQAVGRVIRSESDRGIALLIGQRFATPVYKNLLPSEWGELRQIRSPEALESAAEEFWA